MALTISVTDTLRRSVEAASGGRNTVLYTTKSQPCYMHVVERFSDADGVHPMFMVGGVSKPRRFIGMYPGVIRSGELLSLPGEDPANSASFDSFLSTARSNGNGWGLMTNPDWAGIGYLCLQNGFQPNGNSYYGRSSDLASEQGVRSDGIAIGTTSGNARTLTGSGPTSWRHNNTPWGIADLNGNVWEWSPGMRIVDGEIQIVPDNDAALTSIDLSASAAGWRAIDGATGALVAPGSAGAVRYAASGTANNTLVLNSGGAFESMSNPGAQPVGAAALTLLKRHGLFPRQSAGLSGDAFYITLTGERVPFRGGSWADGSAAGVFALYLIYARSLAITYIGARPAFVA